MLRAEEKLKLQESGSHPPSTTTPASSRNAKRHEVS